VSPLRRHRRPGNPPAEVESSPSPQGAPLPGAQEAAQELTDQAPEPRRHENARVVAVANQKGGVGKSTTAVNLGAALGEIGRKVLVVDLDPQGNASTGLGIEPARRTVGIYQVLSQGTPAPSAVVETDVPGVWAIPSTIDLAGAEIELVSQLARETRLIRAIEAVTPTYDFVLLDCPPSLGLLTVNALSAADELMVPIQCEYYALEGLGQLLRNVRLIQQSLNPRLRLTGIVLTMYNARTRLSEQVVAEVRRYFGPRVYDTIIPRTVRLSEAPGFGRPITMYDSRSKGAKAYRKLAREFMKREATDVPLPAGEPPAAIRIDPQDKEGGLEEMFEGGEEE
jgi:chromosome partitioning protein